MRSAYKREYELNSIISTFPLLSPLEAIIIRGPQDTVFENHMYDGKLQIVFLNVLFLCNGMST